MYQPKISLKNLHLAYEQEVFDQVAVHLLTQNELSMDYEGTCAYRGNLGTMCAAGCLIADTEYNCDYEGAEWDTLVIEYGFPSAHSDLILELQSIHDGQWVHHWKIALIELANSKNLSTSAIDNI